MLIIAPHAPYGYIGALLSALIIVAVFIGLTLSSDVFSGIPRKGFFWYYTNLSNLLVLAYFSLISPLLYAKPALHGFIPYADFYVTASIMLTNTIFHFVILPGVKPQLRRAEPCAQNKMLTVNNLLVHYAVPLLVLAYYLLCAPKKHGLPLSAAPLWLIFPLLYLIAVFAHAKTKRWIADTNSAYPYPFLDVALLGRKRVALTCAALFVLYALFSVSAICIMRGAYAFLGGGKALFLVG